MHRQKLPFKNLILSLVFLDAAFLAVLCPEKEAFADVKACVEAFVQNDMSGHKEVRVVEFKQAERARFQEYYSLELSNKKFYEVRDGFVDSTGKNVKLGSQSLHWFLNTRYGKES